MTRTDLSFGAFRGIISTVKTDVRLAFLLPTPCEIQAITLQCLLSPRHRQTLAPSVLTPEGMSGAFLFNHINQGKQKTPAITGALPDQSQRTGGTL
jgi:hypothetical protein